MGPPPGKLFIVRCPGRHDYGEMITTMLLRPHSHRPWAQALRMQPRVVDATREDALQNLHEELRKPSADASRCSGVIISGSAASAYDTLSWVVLLKALIPQWHALGVKLIGLCFGHQVIAAALGGEVRRNSVGFTVGPRPITFTGPGREHLQKLLGHLPVSPPEVPEALQLWYVHQDHVTDLPPALQPLGGGRVPVLGAFSETVLTFQGHPEFNTEAVVGSCGALKERGCIPPEASPEVGTARATEADTTGPAVAVGAIAGLLLS
eukprot:RCo006053